MGATSDLGLSGATVAHREGFKDVIARVTLGETERVNDFDTAGFGI